MPRKKPFLCVLFLMLVVTVPAYAAPGVEINGELTLSGTGAINFPNGSRQATASTDCIERYELNSNLIYPSGDGTVTDCRTGLIWLKNANCTDLSGGVERAAPGYPPTADPNLAPGYLKWADANTWVAGLGNGLCGLHDGSAPGDWRLPTKTEWMAMVQGARNHHFSSPSLTNAAGTSQWQDGDIFANVQSYHYWASTTEGTDYAWIVRMWDGVVGSYGKTETVYTWPVRAGR